MKFWASIILTAALAGPAMAQDKPAEPPSPQDILDRSVPASWRTIAADDLVVMTLADGGQVIYQLAPDFAPVHVANIRQLVRSGYFDGAVILRVQDNYVVQWGRPDEDPTKPVGIDEHPPAEYDWPLKTLKFKPMPWRDAYARKAGHVASWPVATDGKSAWLVHCYGLIGVARDVAPDTGSSTQLYTVMGHAPRHLDRNLAVVGRIVAGMEYLTARPRGSEALGFYKTGPEQMKIVSARMAADLTAPEQPHWQILDSDTPTFDAWLKARANRSGAFFVKAAGALDVCNALPPVRTHP
ncbi:peptidyl-prolyl cis-trans isomerase [Asticcacaulis biprosthecium C19]|uniref:peptidylprolyl isomerase n=1 Tax=Asticcacaulis biprosthecium C19 TaxID=715226 RepID=F4QHF6_9CAUL|nr:peptidylprolyl isomerase [Asticcacaulis biprosthecium]EGF92693.1 peptidyl-prolyl cis-trans isomerase [Asticcacaulis biprosthecium C19]